MAFENAHALEDAGASEIVIHARTKVDGYKPPAYWDWIAKIKRRIDTPIIANGEIWNAEDARRCQAMSDCEDIMLGRGALAMPNLAVSIRESAAPMPWQEVAQLLIDYSGYEIYGDKGRYYPNRIKQWCGYLKRQYSEAERLFEEIKRLRDAAEIVGVLHNHCSH